MAIYTKTNHAELHKNNVSLDSKWNPIIYFYCIYFAIMFAGGAIGYNFNQVGAAIFLCLFCAWYGRHIFPLRLDVLYLLVFFSMIMPLIPISFYTGDELSRTLEEIIKYYALNIIILIGASLPFPQICKTSKNWILYTVVLIFLIAGCFWPGGHGEHLSRAKGFLANPNNFALTAMMFLLLIDEEKSYTPLKWLNYFVVFSLIYVSKTGGALVGFVIGISYRYVYPSKRGFSVKRLISLVVIFFALSLVFATTPPNTLQPVDKAVEKVSIAKDYINKIFKGKQIDFVSIIRKTGSADASSLAWRFHHWYGMMISFINSPADKQLFGYGIGIADVNYGIKPHNDYLRILYETGFLGFFVNIMIWVVIYRRMDVRYKWLAVMIAVYCFTENNYDHFPAMSFFALYMLSVNKDRIKAAGASSEKEIENSLEAEADLSTDRELGLA